VRRPSGPSEKVRTAMGRQICAAGPSEKARTRRAGSAGCHACQIKRKNPPRRAGGVEICTGGLSAGPKPKIAKRPPTEISSQRDHRRSQRSNPGVSMRRIMLLLLCLGLGARSSVSEPAALEASPRPNENELSSGIHAAINDSHFGPPIEVTDLLRAPPNSSNSWMVCIRGTQSSGPQGWTYSVFFKEKYVQSRYSADYDGCSGQQFHPFVDPAKIPPPSPAPVPKKRHRATAK
jgi:hypothetical protein